MTPNPSFDLQTLPTDHLIDVHRRIDGSEDIPLVGGGHQRLVHLSISSELRSVGNNLSPIGFHGSRNFRIRDIAYGDFPFKPYFNRN
jgi:hypothetical protein